MRVKVRDIEPPVDDGELDELVVEDARAPGGRAADGRAAGGAAHRAPAGVDAASPGDPAIPATVHLVDHRRPLVAADLGPNGDVVLDLLARAARLTRAECRDIERAASWRWWMTTPLPGTGLLGARAAVLAGARAAGRTDALAALEAAVAEVAQRVGGRRAARSRLRTCISSATLAILARDLVEPDVFEVLFAPWRDVMHH